MAVSLQVVEKAKRAAKTRSPFVWSPEQESNLYLRLRRSLFYPLNYREWSARGHIRVLRTRGRDFFRMSYCEASSAEGLVGETTFGLACTGVGRAIRAEKANMVSRATIRNVSDGLFRFQKERMVGWLSLRLSRLKDPSACSRPAGYYDD